MTQYFPHYPSDREEGAPRRADTRPVCPICEQRYTSAASVIPGRVRVITVEHDEDVLACDACAARYRGFSYPSGRTPRNARAALTKVIETT